MSERSFNERLSTRQVDPARLIVCERDGHWALALGRELQGRGVRAYQTRSLAECRDMLGQHRASFLVVEVTRSNLDALLGRLAEIEQTYPAARIAVVADRAMAECELLLREAGAVHFTTSGRGLRPLADAIERHLSSVPTPKLELVERIWNELPWRE